MSTTLVSYRYSCSPLLLRRCAAAWVHALWVLLLACAYGAASEVPRWRWSNPQPHGGNIRAFVSFEDHIVQIAERGQLYRRHPLYDWVPIDTGTLLDMRAAVVFGTSLILTAERGTLLYAPSLDSFRVIELGTSDWLEGVAASASVLISVGDNGAVYRSVDGQVWERQTVPFSTWLTSVAYSPEVGTFVAVGQGGCIATSATGAGWTQQTSPTSVALHRVVWAGERFAAVGANGTVLTSTDGVAWTLETSGAANTLYGVAGDHRWLVIAGEQELWMGERQGSDWTWTRQLTGAPTDPPLWTYLSVFQKPESSAGSPVFLVGGRSGVLIEGQLSQSDWIWSSMNSSLRNWLWDVVRLPGLYVTVGDRANILTSSDGIIWELELSPASLQTNVFLGVGGSTNCVLAAGNQGALAYSLNQTIEVTATNSDGTVTTRQANALGVIWEAVEPRPTTNDLQGIAASADTYVVVGGLGTILTSTSGTNWILRTSGTAESLSSVCAFSGGFVATGNRGTILVSRDNGTTWLPRVSGTTHWIYRVRNLVGGLLAVGQNGTLLASTTGEAWTLIPTGTSQWLNDVIWLDGRYFLAGGQGTVLSSDNLTEWVDAGASTRKTIYALSTEGSRLVAVGVEGLILRSPIVAQITPPILLNYSHLMQSRVFEIQGETDQRLVVERAGVLANPPVWQAGPELEIWGPDGRLIHAEGIPPDPLPAEYYRLRVLE